MYYELVMITITHEKITHSTSIWLLLRPSGKEGFEWRRNRNRFSRYSPAKKIRGESVRVRTYTYHRTYTIVPTTYVLFCNRSNREERGRKGRREQTSCSALYTYSYMGEIMFWWWWWRRRRGRGRSSDCEKIVIIAVKWNRKPLVLLLRLDRRQRILLFNSFAWGEFVFPFTLVSERCPVSVNIV